MKQVFFLILVFYASGATVSASEQYLLRIDTVGYIKSIEESPKRKVLHSIEVVTRPNETFHCKVQTGGFTRTMSGKLVYEDGEFTAHIHYHRTFDDGTKVLGKSLLDETGVKTSTGVTLAKSVLIGGAESEGETVFASQTKTKTKGKKHFVPLLSKVIDGFETKEKAASLQLTKTKTKEHFILFLSKYEPATE
ncbi:hypothetical protein [Gimesia aquarii]|uniref:Uncharacterized protein n=1 Tax=Gimesia aquarii TaxID=2527964 RepID=A0A517W1W1_9PLAN|nr:hypothetical protein [Gimesia aquarii]QDT99239.1 hypothetical protein V144x_47500 [Gimesia aquarii]